VDEAIACVDAGEKKPADSLKSFVDQCLFSTRMQEQDRVRALAYASPLWGGPRAVFLNALNHLKKIDKDDLKVLGPIVLSSILAWLQYDSFPSLDGQSIDYVQQICGTLGSEADTWRTKVNEATEHASKNYRGVPIIFPCLAPPETVRLQFVDLLELNRRVLCEEIVSMIWRIFVAIRSVEWASYVTNFTGRDQKRESSGCENILSLIQFTKSLQHWVRTSVAMRKDKAKVIMFWINVAEMILSVNCHHGCYAIFEAIENCFFGDSPVVFSWPEAFPNGVVASFNKLKASVSGMPGKLEVYLQHASNSTTSADKLPFVPPLSKLLLGFESLMTRDEEKGIQCPVVTLVGLIQAMLLIQQGLRHYGVSMQALSHDMHDLLQEMPLLPEQLLVHAAKASERGLNEPDYSDDTVSSDRVQSSDMSSDAGGGGSLRGGDTNSTTPPMARTPRTPSPIFGGSPKGSPNQTPRSASLRGNLTKSNSVGGNDRSDLGLSIQSRVLSQRGAAKAVLNANNPVEKHVLFLSSNGKIRFEDDVVGKKEHEDANDEEVIKFSLTCGVLRVIWVRGLRWLARLLTGNTPLGFSPSVVDDILFGWRLIFKKPSELFCLLVNEYPEVPVEKVHAHLMPDSIFGTDSVRGVRKRVLYAIKRLVDIERSCASTLADDTELMECWQNFYWRLKTGTSAPPGSPGQRKLSAHLSRASSGMLSRDLSLQQVTHSLDEFVSASTIDWSLRNSKVRVMVPTCAPPSDYDLLNTSEAQLVESLTLVEQNAFGGIGVGELLGFQPNNVSEMVFSTTEDKELMEEVSGIGFNWLKWTVGRFNRTTAFVASRIVLEDDIDTRAGLILFFMRMVSGAVGTGNVSMGYAIFAGLECLPVVRLKRTWVRVNELDPKKVVQNMFEPLKDMFSPESGHYQLRVHHLSNLSRIKVPFVGLWTKDVYLIDRNNPTYVEPRLKSSGEGVDMDQVRKNSKIDSTDGGIVPPSRSMQKSDVVNVEKLSMIADSICRVIFFQGNEHVTAQQKGNTVIDPIGTYPVLDEEALYKASLRREPKSISVQNPLKK
jgi:hypothetical protein